MFVIFSHQKTKTFHLIWCSFIRYLEQSTGLLHSVAEWTHRVGLHVYKTQTYFFFLALFYKINQVNFRSCGSHIQLVQLIFSRTRTKFGKIFVLMAYLHCGHWCIVGAAPCCTRALRALVHCGRLMVLAYTVDNFMQHRGDLMGIVRDYFWWVLFGLLPTLFRLEPMLGPLDDGST